MKKLVKKIKQLFSRSKKVEHEVMFAGKKHFICSNGKPDISPQQFIDRHAVACARCGDIMLPGDSLWLYQPEKKSEFDKPNVLAIGEGDKRALVACLGWDCCPTAGLMCGRLDMDKQIVSFESPMQQALRTGQPVIVSDVSTYKG